MGKNKINNFQRSFIILYNVFIILYYVTLSYVKLIYVTLRWVALYYIILYSHIPGRCTKKYWMREWVRKLVVVQEIGRMNESIRET